MERAEGTSWENRRRNGVTLPFQVNRNFVKPSLGNCACNLFSKDT